MAQDTGQERNEAPTERRREEARKKGQVASSNELSNAILLLTGLAVFWFLSKPVAYDLMNLLRQELLHINKREWSAHEAVSAFTSAFYVVANLVVPFNIILITPVVGFSIAQRGFQVNFEALTLDWNKVLPTQGFSRLFSLRSVLRATMLVLNLATAIGLLVWLVGPKLVVFASFGRISLFQSIPQTWAIAIRLSLALAAALLAAGALDLLFQIFRHEQDLKMTKQELRDEQKEQDIDPQVRSRIKQAQREATKQRMLRNVPTADLVIRNPTHIAVALKYERGRMNAPIVVAKGKDFLALRIIQIAEEHRISVIERKPLARSLYAMVEVNDEIPPALYRAIAEVLSYIYGLKNKRDRKK